MDLSLFRSQPYFQQLEVTMQGLYDWADEGKKVVAKDVKSEKSNKPTSRRRVAKAPAKGGFGSS
jgi:hypothetical protein